MRSSENVCNNSGGFSKKARQGQNRMKFSLAQKVVHFQDWPPVEGNVFFWRFLFDLTWFSTKLKGIGVVFSWKPMFVCFITLSKKIQLIPFEVFKGSVSNGRKPTGRSSLYVKTSDSHFDNRNENLEGFHWNSENRPTLVSTCVCIIASPAVLNIWPEKIFFPSKFSYVLFRNPTHKTKIGTTNRCGTINSKPCGPIIMMG